MVWFGVCTVVPSAYCKAYQQEDWYSSAYMKKNKQEKKEAGEKWKAGNVIELYLCNIFLSLEKGMANHFCILALRTP